MKGWLVNCCSCYQPGTAVQPSPSCLNFQPDNQLTWYDNETFFWHHCVSFVPSTLVSLTSVFHRRALINCLLTSVTTLNSSTEETEVSRETPRPSAKCTNKGSVGCQSGNGLTQASMGWFLSVSFPLATLGSQLLGIAGCLDIEGAITYTCSSNYIFSIAVLIHQSHQIQQAISAAVK